MNFNAVGCGIIMNFAATKHLLLTVVQTFSQCHVYLMLHSVAQINLWKLNVLLTMHHVINFIPVTNLMHKFLYSYNVYSPLHASSSIMLIIRRSNSKYTVYGIVTVYEWSWWSYGTLVERVLFQPVYCTTTKTTHSE